ncbi:hypothetical protein RN607_00535 [Demequina capsici]|uniref:Uncharacterized protein n=1 Tax=Demequina capsici TaxID=3075620 RepID=A0AA96FC00_9MICO|nr:hypothetical protein [Demequina sp. PMTSA13]WNM27519.1 hypothetical protein RN607_00535 [Demequina sp. PMTSA13]
MPTTETTQYLGGTVAGTGEFLQASSLTNLANAIDFAEKAAEQVKRDLWNLGVSEADVSVTPVVVQVTTKIHMGTRMGLEVARKVLEDVR